MKVVFVATLLLAFVTLFVVVASAARAPRTPSGTPSMSVSDSNLPPLHEDVIRCTVCNRAIEHIWDKGEKLRKHCKEEGTDPRCDFSNMHAFGIEEMAHAACEDLPKNYKAIHDSEFDLVLHDDPDHPEHVSKAISKACRAWVHDEHGAEEVALFIFANLDSGKAKGTILHNLQHRFCRNACNANFKRKKHVHDKYRYEDDEL